MVPDAELYLFLMLFIGFALGAGGASAFEMLLIRALKDGVIDASEKPLISGMRSFIQVGFFVVCLSQLLLLLYYKSVGHTQVLWSGGLWAEICILVVLAASAIYPDPKKRLTLPISAVSIVSWYFAFFVSAFYMEGEQSFSSIIFVYLICLLCGLFVFGALRKLSGVHMRNI